MLNPLKCVLRKYKSLVVKMHIDASKSKPTKKILDLLCDLELVLGLPCIFPMLEAVHTLIKYAQRRNAFICEFTDVVKSKRPSYIDFMLILFVSMTILLLMNSLLFVNIIVSYYPSFGFHMNPMLIYTCCNTWHSTLLVTTIDSITMEVLMVLMFM
jgi:hypothetical protein